MDLPFYFVYLAEAQPEGGWPHHWWTVIAFSSMEFHSAIHLQNRSWDSKWQWSKWWQVISSKAINSKIDNGKTNDVKSDGNKKCHQIKRQGWSSYGKMKVREQQENKHDDAKLAKEVQEKLKSLLETMTTKWFRNLSSFDQLWIKRMNVKTSYGFIIIAVICCWLVGGWG